VCCCLVTKRRRSQRSNDCRIKLKKRRTVRCTVCMSRQLSPLSKLFHSIPKVSASRSFILRPHLLCAPLFYVFVQDQVRFVAVVPADLNLLQKKNLFFIYFFKIKMCIRFYFFERRNLGFCNVANGGSEEGLRKSMCVYCIQFLQLRVKVCIWKAKKERGPCAAFIKGHGERGGGGSVAVDGGGSLVYSPLNNLKC